VKERGIDKKQKRRGTRKRKAVHRITSCGEKGCLQFSGKLPGVWQKECNKEKTKEKRLQVVQSSSPLLLKEGQENRQGKENKEQEREGGRKGQT